MKFTTTYKLEDFIVNLKWSDIPEEVRRRMKGCFIDLCGALLVGSRSRQFKVGLDMARCVFRDGNIPIVGTNVKLSAIGAASAMGHASNAFDIDDGHNMTRAHPGTSFVGGVLAAAYEKDVSRNEFLTAMLCAYEGSVRNGAAIMDYYNYAHSSGTFGAVGTAIGVGKISGFTREEMNNVISVAEFNAPLVPGIRSVEYPSMNKDGVPFGVMAGMLAVNDCMHGFTGNKNLLEAEEYKHYTDDLGEKYEVMDLYFKPYPCCRWAHPAIDAVTKLMSDNNIKHTDIKHITIKTFKRATMLSKGIPTTTDEAQYNIAYPVAAAAVHGTFGLAEVSDDGLTDKNVHEMMKKLSFEVDDEFDALFPGKRFCRAYIDTVDGSRFISEALQPYGEASDNIGTDWLSEKFNRTASPVMTESGRKKLLSMILAEEDFPIRTITDIMCKKEYLI